MHLCQVSYVLVLKPDLGSLHKIPAQTLDLRRHRVNPLGTPAHAIQLGPLMLDRFRAARRRHEHLGPKAHWWSP